MTKEQKWLNKAINSYDEKEGLEKLKNKKKEYNSDKKKLGYDGNFFENVKKK